MRTWARLLRDFRKLRSAPSPVGTITFYSEGKENWPHFKPLVHEFAEKHKLCVHYVSSRLDDPGLSFNHPMVKPYFIGEGVLRTVWFRISRAPVIIMTLPDLDNSFIKRSAYGSTYVYVHHSMVSTHMIYKEDAFDHFDVILCVGPHHIREIRERETRMGLKKKKLVEYGYGLLDDMLAQHKPSTSQNDNTCVLIAPSWGSCCILETCGSELIEVLLNAGLSTTVRPHPMTGRMTPNVLNEIRAKFNNHPKFSWDENVVNHQSYIDADIMISDWSGAALEFAFAFEKPVLFIDTPAKVRNPNYKEISAAPIEDTLRTSVGDVVSPEHLSKVPNIILEMIASRRKLINGIHETRSATVFNVGNSAQVGAEKILRILEEDHLCEDVPLNA